MHQIAEYILAVVFIAQGLQSKTPAVPSVLGGLVLLNAACAKGPAAAFQLLGRALHRLIDLVLIAAIVVIAVQPVISLDNNTRVIMGVLAFMIAFVWLGSDFSEPVAKPRSRPLAGAARVASSLRRMTTPEPTVEASTTNAPTGSKAEDVGRTAGRLAGKGVNMYRSRKARRSSAKK